MERVSVKPMTLRKGEEKQKGGSKVGEKKRGVKPVPYLPLEAAWVETRKAQPGVRVGGENV